MDPLDVLAAAREHAAAEAVLDADRTLATLCPHPVFEFYPSRLTIGGWDNIEAFYREQFPKFSATVADARVFDEWANENVAIQEYDIDIRSGEGTETYRVLSMAPITDDGKLAGERLYCDVGFLRHLLGPLFNLCEPISD